MLAFFIFSDCDIELTLLVAASRTKLPLREGNYVSQSNEKAVSQVLRAAALTYVSAALADILNLGRWIVILSRR